MASKISFDDLTNISMEKLDDPNSASNSIPKMSDAVLHAEIQSVFSNFRVPILSQGLRKISPQLWKRFPHQGSLKDINEWCDEWFTTYPKAKSTLMLHDEKWWSALRPHVDQLSKDDLEEHIFPIMNENDDLTASLLTQMLDHPQLKSLYIAQLHKSVYTYVGNSIEFDGVSTDPTKASAIIDVWSSLPLPPTVTSHIACMLLRSLGRATDWEGESDEAWNKVVLDWFHAWPQHHQAWKDNPPTCTLEILHDNLPHPLAWKEHWETFFGTPPLAQRQWALCAVVEHNDINNEEDHVLMMSAEDIDGYEIKSPNQQTIDGFQQLLSKWLPTSSDRQPWLKMIAPTIQAPVLELLLDGVLTPDDWQCLANQSVALEIQHHPLIVKGTLQSNMPKSSKSSPSKKM